MTTYPLIVVQPLAITDAMVSAPNTNVPETDYAAWSSATTYALSARVILTSAHKIYQSLQASNLNKDPTTQPLWWVEVSPTNKWALFDSAVSTQTKQSTYIKYTVTPGQTINAIETGKFDPSLPLAFRAARLFALHIEEIFQDE